MEKYSQPPGSSPSHVKGFLRVSLDTKKLLNVRTGGESQNHRIWEMECTGSNPGSATQQLCDL